MMDFDKEDYKYLKKLAKTSNVNTVSIEFEFDGAECYKGFTVAYRPMTKGPDCRMVEVAVSYCAKEDQFKKKVGKYIALDRLYNEQTIQLPLGACLNSSSKAYFKRALTSIFAV